MKLKIFNVTRFTLGVLFQSWLTPLQTLVSASAQRVLRSMAVFPETPHPSAESRVLLDSVVESLSKINTNNNLKNFIHGETVRLKHI